MGPVAVLGGAYLGIVVFARHRLFARRPRLFLVPWPPPRRAWPGSILLDYRLRQNQYYMFLWVNLAYLTVPVPAKRKSLQVLIALFYLWAGVLKVNLASGCRERSSIGSCGSSRGRMPRWPAAT